MNLKENEMDKIILTMLILYVLILGYGMGTLDRIIIPFLGGIIAILSIIIKEKTRRKHDKI